MAAIKFLNNLDLKKNQLINTSIHNSTTEPSDPVKGQLWFDTNIGVNRLKYFNGAEWVTADASQALASLDGDSLISLLNTPGVVSKISVKVGGTGLDGSVATNGQLLIGNGSGFSLGAITVSSPLSITLGSGTIALSHVNTDGNKHVPANSTTNGGKVLTASSVAGTYTWETPSVKWANVSDKPSSSVSNIDAAVSKMHDQNTDTGTTSVYFHIESGNGGPRLYSEAGSLTFKNTTGANQININAASFTALDNLVIKNGSYSQTIVTSTLTGNRTLTLANGNTTLVAGTMVPTSRTLTITTNNGLTGGTSALDLSTNRSWTLGLTGQAKAFHDLATNGIVTRTGADTIVARTITGVSNKITVTNGNGVSGNPTIDIASTYAGQSSITTLGTITTGTWQGNVVGVKYGGTGVDASAAANGTLLIGNGAGLTLTTLTGTANQVTVTNASGSITLKTPQNIHTSATPQFARLGLGVAADATANLKLSAGTMVSGVTNGASAIGFTLTTPAYSTAGAKLLSVKNGSSEKLSVDLNGLITADNIKITGTPTPQDEVVMFSPTGTLVSTGIDASLFATGGRYAVVDRDKTITNTDLQSSIPFDLGIFEKQTDALIVYENYVYYLEPGVDYEINSTNDGINLLGDLKPKGTRYDFLAIKNVPEDGHTYSGIYIADGTVTNTQLATDIKVGSLNALNVGIAGTNRNSVVEAINYVYTNSAQLQNSLTLSFEGGTTEGTNKYTFNGGSSKSINFVGEANVITVTPTVGKVQIKGGANLNDAIAKRHTQNTDTGTTSQTFVIQSGGTNGGIKLKHNAVGAASELQIRNSGDTDYANLRVKDLYVEGTTTTINSNEVWIGDNIIELNSDIATSAQNFEGGIEVKRLKTDNTTKANAGLIFNNSNGKWEAKFGPVADVITREITTKFVATIGNGSATSIRLNHKLNTRDLTITVRENTSPYAVVYTDIQFYDTNNVDLIFAVAPTSNQYVVTIIG